MPLFVSTCGNSLAGWIAATWMHALGVSRCRCLDHNERHRGRVDREAYGNV